MIVHGDCEHFLCSFLTDNILVQVFFDLYRCGQFSAELRRRIIVELFTEDVVAQVDAFIANVDVGASDELSYLVLCLGAK